MCDCKEPEAGDFLVVGRCYWCKDIKACRVDAASKMAVCVVCDEMLEYALKAG